MKLALIYFCVVGAFSFGCKAEGEDPGDDYRSSSGATDRTGPIRSNSAEILTEEEPARLNEFGCDSNAWWDRSFTRRYQLIIGTGVKFGLNAEEAIPVVIDHGELVSLGFASADGSDLALVYYNSQCEFEPVDFTVDVGSSLNLERTALRLRVNSTLAAGAVDRQYYLYVSNPAATSSIKPKNEMFLAFHDFETMPSAEEFFYLQEGAGVSVDNGDLVIAAATTAETQYSPFGLLSTAALPVGTIVTTEFSILDRGSENWKATVGVPAELMLLYQRELKYYTPDPNAAIFTSLSGELFPELIYRKQVAEVHVEKGQLSFYLNGQIVATRARNTDNFQLRLSFSPDGIVDAFEYRVHYSAARALVAGEDKITSRLINPVVIR